MIRNIINRILHRLASTMPGGKRVRPFLHRIRGVKMGKNVWVSQFVYIDELYPEAVTIGDNSTLGLRTTIFTHLYFGPRQKNKFGEVVIEKNVFIGPHCVILPNVRIGEGSVIKAGTVVTKNVPPHTFLGTPAPIALANVTTPLTSEHTYEEFINGLRPVRTRNPKE
jgi:acetyltransferase-like isoleucine patch superfamily enzyme